MNSAKISNGTVNPPILEKEEDESNTDVTALQK
jgi:hypothetical protein